LVATAYGQDAEVDAAKALLAKGVEQYQALDFTQAKATLLQVDSAKLPKDSAQVLKRHLEWADIAIARQAAGMEAFRRAQDALKASKLQEAAKLFQEVLANEFVPQPTRQEAKTLAAETDAKIKLAGAPAATATAPAAPTTPTPSTPPPAVTATTKPATMVAVNPPKPAVAPVKPQTKPAMAPAATTPPAVTAKPAPAMAPAATTPPAVTAKPAPAMAPAATTPPAVTAMPAPAMAPAAAAAATPPAVTAKPAPAIAPAATTPPAVTAEPAPAMAPAAVAVTNPPAAVEEDPQAKLRAQAKDIQARNDAQDLVKQGNMALDVGNTDAAVRAFNRALELAPGMPEAQEGLAIAGKKLEQTAEPSSLSELQRTKILRKQLAMAEFDKAMEQAHKALE
jgi:tetratricopeptide (TPR) repeat protein